MKIIQDNSGYINSLLLLILLIPIIFLILLSVSQMEVLVNDSVDVFEGEKLSSKTSEYVEQLNTVSMDAMHNLSYQCISDKRVLSNTSKSLKSIIQESANNLSVDYHKNGININCRIINVVPSINPFEFNVYYRVNSSIVNDSANKNINQRGCLNVSIVDNEYPVYDPIPLFTSNVNIIDNKYIYDSVYPYNNYSYVYRDADSGIIIKKCVYDDYTLHGHSNASFNDCLKNHYYHFSHDGLCIFCRLENRTSCIHNGLETFIVSHNLSNNSIVSVDHVLFNTTGNQYEGDVCVISDSTFIYLDNGHKSKYGL